MLELIRNVNFILAADSYKGSHYKQLVKDLMQMYSVVVPRKYPEYTKELVAAGQSMAAHVLANVRITMEDVEEAMQEGREQGYKLNPVWYLIPELYEGRLPVAMYGIEEGRVIPVQTPIVGLIATDFRFVWLASYLETVVQRIIWKMSTVASVSRACWKNIGNAMLKDGSNMAGLEYKLHNFGDRGADGYDAAVMAAIAHAMLFSGSDCLSANRYIKKLYNTDKAYLSSIGATEHSTMCANSDASTKDDFGAAVMVVEQLEEAVRLFKEEGIGIPLHAGVIDTYNSKRFAGEYLGTILKDRIVNSGGTLVARPDSGDPLVEPIEVIKVLAGKFGCNLNKEGYRVMHPAIRAIQGDGINVRSIPQIMANLNEAGYAVENLAFGMGGGLTHEAGRDEFSFSMKATAMRRDGKEWENLLKEPITDLGKKSLSGLVRCKEVDGELVTFVAKDEVELATTGPGWRLWCYNGFVTHEENFDDVRARARFVKEWNS